MHIGRDVLGVNVDVLYSIVVELHGRDVLGVHVDVRVLCRSFNYMDEMYCESMWLYMCCAGCTCVVQAVHALFRSFNYTDEMCWGSMWMYKATGDDKYLTEARQWFDTQPDWGMSWDDKVVGCQVRLMWIV